MRIATQKSSPAGIYELSAPVGVAAHLALFLRVRADSEALVRGLSAEDQTVQTMADVSPTKWHLAHSSWFFETFLLARFVPDYQPFHPSYGYLFNSYYERIGRPYPRPERGLLSRPGVSEILEYRAHIDKAVVALLERTNEDELGQIGEMLILGLHHEQQHQELILTDIKHVLAHNPLAPAAYTQGAAAVDGPVSNNTSWFEHEGGLVELGHEARQGFAFDNEGPRHQALLRPFRLARDLVSNGEYLAFMEDGGYQRPDFWLAEGWAEVCAQGWEAPLYWRKKSGDWEHFTLSGLKPLAEDAPVAHLSFYEASAFADWAGKRLPREGELELAESEEEVGGNLGCAQLEGTAPEPQSGGGFWGDVWEWTMSPYSAFPGFHASASALGEYNGKFMCNQFVLKGGSCATAPGHIRATYRNFFPPSARWQFSGLRLAEGD